MCKGRAGKEGGGVRGEGVQKKFKMSSYLDFNIRTVIQRISLVTCKNGYAQQKSARTELLSPPTKMIPSEPIARPLERCPLGWIHSITVTTNINSTICTNSRRGSPAIGADGTVYVPRSTVCGGY